MHAVLRIKLIEGKQLQVHVECPYRWSKQVGATAHLQQHIHAGRVHA